MEKLTKKEEQQIYMAQILSGFFGTRGFHKLSRDMLERLNEDVERNYPYAGKITYPLLAEFLFEVGAFIMAEHNRRTASEPIE